MMQYRIKALLKAKGIKNDYTTLIKMGLNHSKVVRLLSNENVRLDKKTMNTICETLWCTPNDLFEWTPAQSTLDQPTHPLQALKPQALYAIGDDIKKLTPAQLRQLEQKMKEVLGE